MIRQLNNKTLNPDILNTRFHIQLYISKDYLNYTKKSIYKSKLERNSTNEIDHVIGLK